MIRRILAAAVVATFMAASATSPVLAQDKKKATAEKRAPSAGLMATRERQKKCGAEWKEAKAAGKVEKGMKWSKYWSACNKRLKEAGT